MNELLKKTKNEFTENMNDDFNTRGAMSSIFLMVRDTNKAMGDRSMSKKGADDSIRMLREFDTIFSILPEDTGTDDSLDAVMNIMMDMRSELRKRKLFDMADMIRNRLEEAGIKMEDTAEGAKWKKI
jgi:cysteinyl-tRNA synthetase